MTNKMARKEARAINAALREAGFDGRGRWPTVGAAHVAVADVLGRFGYEFTETLSTWQVGGKGAGSLSLGVSRSGGPFVAVPVRGSMLHFSYTDLDHGRFEVIAYL